MIDNISQARGIWTDRANPRTEALISREENADQSKTSDKATAPPERELPFSGRLTIDHSIDTEALFAKATDKTNTIENSNQRADPELSMASVSASGPTSVTPFAKETAENTGDHGNTETNPVEPESTETPGENIEGSDNTDMEEGERQEVRELEQRDQEVRRHEQAHIAAGGQYVRGGAKFDMETGPNQKQYAVGGEVSIDTSKGGTPEETIQKAAVIQRAALAPANPSPQDRKVASNATAMATAARRELMEQQPESSPKPEEAGENKDHVKEKPVEAENARDSRPEEGIAERKSMDKPGPRGIEVIAKQSQSTRAKQTYGQAPNSNIEKGNMFKGGIQSRDFGGMGGISSLDAQM